MYNKTLYCSDVIGWVEAILDHSAIKTHLYFVHVASKTTESSPRVAWTQQVSFEWAFFEQDRASLSWAGARSNTSR